jgi:hypothetical protein
MALSAIEPWINLDWARLNIFILISYPFPKKNLIQNSPGFSQSSVSFSLHWAVEELNLASLLLEANSFKCPSKPDNLRHFSHSFIFQSTLALSSLPLSLRFFAKMSIVSTEVIAIRLRLVYLQFLWSLQLSFLLLASFSTKFCQIKETC